MVTLLAASEQCCEDRANAQRSSLILCGTNCILESRQRGRGIGRADQRAIVSVWSSMSALEAVGGAGEFGRMGDVFAGFFAAEAGSWKNFSGIAEIKRVEGAADALHGGEVGFGEHFGHGVFFVLAAAVFAGDGAAGGDAEVEVFGGGG